MEFSEILKRRRSIRRFRQEEIPLETLKELVEAAALAPSAANAQCLRYVLVREKELLRAVLEQTAWGGHVKPYRNPEFGVTGPTAFLAVCTDLRAVPGDGSGTGRLLDRRIQPSGGRTPARTGKPDCALSGRPRPSGGKSDSVPDRERRSDAVLSGFGRCDSCAEVYGGRHSHHQGMTQFWRIGNDEALQSQN